MPNVIEINKLPNVANLYSRIATTLLKKGKGNLPDVRVEFNNQSIQPSDFKKYNKVCGFEHTLIVPSTFIHAYTFPLQTILLSHPSCPFPLLGLVHFANSIKQIRPLYVGENFSISCSFGNLIAHEKGQAFEVNSYLEVDGIRIWEDASIYLYRTKEGVGQVFDWKQPILQENCIKKSWSLHQTLGFEYAQSSGDFNPIHLHPLTAKLFGFDRHIIHGMWTKAKILTELEKQLSTSYEIAVCFKTPVYLPASIIFRYEKTEQGFDFDVVDKLQEKPHVKGYILNL